MTSNKPVIDPRRKPSLQVYKPTEVGPGKSRINLFGRRELEEYARTHPGPGLLAQLSEKVKELLKRSTKP